MRMALERSSGAPNVVPTMMRSTTNPKRMGCIRSGAYPFRHITVRSPHSARFST